MSSFGESLETVSSPSSPREVRGHMVVIGRTLPRLSAPLPVLNPADVGSVSPENSCEPGGSAFNSPSQLNILNSASNQQMEEPTDGRYEPEENFTVSDASSPLA